MKLSDYVMEFISGLGVRHVFCVTGGGAMHLNDSLGRSEKLKGVFMLHEQGASIAAEAYARMGEGYGVCLVTGGPGGTNAVTGLCGAYMDSIPVIFISGQAKRDDLVGDQGVRQFGIQEVDIISIVESYTKYAVQILDESRIRYEMEKAVWIAVNGRPGPIWIDIPLDIQAMEIEEESLERFYPDRKNVEKKDNTKLEKISRLLDEARRPVLYLGNGIRLSHAVNSARDLVDKLGIPTFVSWNGVDLLENDHPMYFGRPSIVGDRYANLILQNADFVLSIGARLSLLNTGYNFKEYLKNAVHVMVDIDEKEMKKKSVHPNMGIVCDAGRFIDDFLEYENGKAKKNREEWIAYCRRIRTRYTTSIPEQEPRKGFISVYRLYEMLSEQMTSDDIFQFSSSGTGVDIGMKALRLKRGQRAFLNKSMAAMGYDIPASIGSCIAAGGKRTVCVTGDGSIAMNMQELEVLHRLDLPIKLIVLDNQGYSMIWQSQRANFNGRLTGCTEESGLTLPNMAAIAKAFGIKSVTVEREDELDYALADALAYEGPIVCVVKTDISQKILPKQSSFMNEHGQMESRPIHDMAPLLEREELAEWML